MKKFHSNNNTNETVNTPFNELISSKNKWNKEYLDKTNSINNSNNTYNKTSLYNESKISYKNIKSLNGISKNKKFNNKSTDNYNDEIFILDSIKNKNGKKDDHYSKENYIIFSYIIFL
jgi:hypothetical protein